MTSDDKVGGWVKKGQNHDDIILECPLRKHVIVDPTKQKKKAALLRALHCLT